MTRVNRDIAARNVLVDGSYVCNVADFGLGRETSSNYYTQEQDSKYLSLFLFLSFSLSLFLSLSLSLSLSYLGPSLVRCLEFVCCPNIRITTIDTDYRSERQHQKP